MNTLIWSLRGHGTRTKVPERTVTACRDHQGTSGCEPGGQSPTTRSRVMTTSPSLLFLWRALRALWISGFAVGAGFTPATWMHRGCTLTCPSVPPHLPIPKEYFGGKYLEQQKSKWPSSMVVIAWSLSSCRATESGQSREQQELCEWQQCACLLAIRSNVTMPSL